MNKKLQSKLYKKYPDLFKQHALSPDKTCMCWGIDCDDGWYDLLDILCGYIVSNDKNIEAVQIKQKFGGLRFYVNYSNDDIDRAISIAESLSYKICEKCGSYVDKVKTVPYNGWIQSLCNKCRREKKS